MHTVPGFEQHTLNLQGVARDVYRAGRGPAVIVMSEIPGITPAVAGFAQRLVDAGYTVFMPLLFGEPMRRPGAWLCAARDPESVHQPGIQCPGRQPIEPDRRLAARARSPGTCRVRRPRRGRHRHVFYG